MQIPRVTPDFGSELVAALPDPVAAPVVQVVDIEHSVLVPGSRQGIELILADAARPPASMLSAGTAAVVSCRCIRDAAYGWKSCCRVPTGGSRASRWHSTGWGEVGLDALADLCVAAAVHRGGLENAA
jgi:hypothetical protein